ncbi:hypothetical protein ACIA5G_33815 [Amycolatopsis sp. NPDC051758]|uniref:hypothetical protein n=1 Tax=Amycolatopsis sp. NPDC051758 TaxID=3363935 RepID=UPI0037B469AC
MSRGLTRRAARSLAAEPICPAVLAVADHEADLLGHPYIGAEHLELARLLLAGRHGELREYRERLVPGVPPRWWRPRGPHSALRRAGRDRTAAAQRAAWEREALAVQRVLPERLRVGLPGNGRITATASWLGAVSVVLWAGSWILVWHEIFRWHHMTKTLRFQVRDIPPGMPEPKPGLPVIALRVVAIASPVIAVVSFGVAKRGRRRDGGN